MKRVFTLLAGIAVVAGLVGAAAAQAPTSQPPAQKKAAKQAPHRSAVGTVKSAAADSLVIAGKTKGKDTELTFVVDSSTRIKKSGKDVTATALAAGDRVTVRYTEQDGKMMASSVVVAPGAAPKAAKKDDKK